MLGIAELVLRSRTDWLESIRAMSEATMNPYEPPAAPSTARSPIVSSTRFDPAAWNPYKNALAVWGSALTQLAIARAFDTPSERLPTLLFLPLALANFWLTVGWVLGLYDLVAGSVRLMRGEPSGRHCLLSVALVLVGYLCRFCGIRAGWQIAP